MNKLFEQYPLYSPWPARLLGIEPWETRKKNPRSILREYDGEKWGSLYRAVKKQKKITLAQADQLSLEGEEAFPATEGENWHLIKPLQAVEKHRSIVRRTFSRLPKPNAIVELGAGYGAILLDLAQHSKRSIPFFAGEYTESGRNLIQEIARQEKLPVTTGACDFFQENITNLKFPEGSAIYTSMAACYVKKLKPAFVESFLSLRPSWVVHFEPCFEHYSPDSLLGLMRRRYVQANGYNENLLSLLQAMEKKGRLQITGVEENVFGANPFMPYSIIVWKPRN